MLVSFFIFLSGVALSESVSFAPQNTVIGVGGVANVTVVLDSLPNGLAGYVADVSLSDPACGEIISVTYPQWAMLTNTTGVPGNAIRISGVDLNKNVQPGATNVVIASLAIRGDQAGTCAINLRMIKIDADGGDKINVSVTDGLITIQPTSSPTPTTVPTATSTVTATPGPSPTSNPAGTPTNNPVSTQYPSPTPIVTPMNTVEPSKEASPSPAVVEPTESASPAPTQGPGSIYLVAVMLAILAIIIAIGIYWIKKK